MRDSTFGYREHKNIGRETVLSADEDGRPPSLTDKVPHFFVPSVLEALKDEERGECGDDDTGNDIDGGSDGAFDLKVIPKGIEPVELFLVKILIILCRDIFGAVIEDIYRVGVKL